ncbi:hypothetical protein BU25DRAFT_42640 [Macroventuria anomochaeta]|uniref:Uncharacterized protein n=1 Tax=Macroventuria anomochaeta TaxID=301207 RepID=A0ACB6S3Z2_9PLEO|nr:uncharacterized protein BU25DRAFT_42640 [Macroventuria anomochaeta]KAF2628242.1 hypothetical protein BU25DRAFT_42640 [Macroventuria anomochaeta]
MCRSQFDRKCTSLWGLVGFASQTAATKRLMMTGLRLQSGHGQEDNRALLTSPICILLLLPSLLPLASLEKAQLPSIHLPPPPISSLHRLVVLPHEAPSRVLALASVLQPYRPLLARARARPLVTAPPFALCSTVYVLASQAAAPLFASKPGWSLA